MLAVIDVVIPVFLVVGFGYVTVWQGLYQSHVILTRVGFPNQ
jgi:hypothetical protein